MNLLTVNHEWTNTKNWNEINGLTLTKHSIKNKQNENNPIDSDNYPTKFHNAIPGSSTKNLFVKAASIRLSS